MSEALEEHCDGDPFVRDVTCPDEGFTHECFPGVYAADSDSCSSE